MDVYLSKSTKKDKKWMVYFPEVNKIVHFGAQGYLDYTQHKDKDRKERYIIRHKNRENWTDIYSAGFWSRWLLWNKPTLYSSAKDIKKQFHLNIAYL